MRDRYYRLLGSRCEDCGGESFPPVHFCRRCGSSRITDKEMPREGRVETFTTLREVMAGFEEEAPLTLAIVKLDNGARVLAQLVDTVGDEVKMGDRVRMVFRKVRTDGDSGQIWYGYKFSLIRQ